MDHSTAKFWDRMAEGYSKQPIGDEDAYQKKLEITRGYLKPDMQILEFGCGTGSTAITHAPHVKHIHAIDISANMIDIAQSKAEALGIENITFERLILDELNTADQTLDMALGLSILHLVEDKGEAIEKIYALLKPGGVFVTSTACLGEKMAFLKVLAPIGRFLRLLPVLKVFTAKELEADILRAGFEIEHNWRPDKSIAVFMVARKPAL